MLFQFDMSARDYPPLEAAPPQSSEATDLLRQMLDVQKDQLAHLRALLGAHDVVGRWRAFMSRWQNDFADLPDACRQTLPALERSYGKLLVEMTEFLGQDGADTLENDFALQDFLDRYGMRLTQLGTILNLVAPFAEIGPASGSSG